MFSISSFIYSIRPIRLLRPFSFVFPPFCDGLQFILHTFQRSEFLARFGKSPSPRHFLAGFSLSDGILNWRRMLLHLYFNFDSFLVNQLDKRLPRAHFSWGMGRGVAAKNVACLWLFAKLEMFHVNWKFIETNCVLFTHYWRFSHFSCLFCIYFCSACCFVWMNYWGKVVGGNDDGNENGIGNGTEATFFDWLQFDVILAGFHLLTVSFFLHILCDKHAKVITTNTVRQHHLCF